MSSIFEIVADLNAQRGALGDKREKLIRDYQEKCPHPLSEIVEGDYIPSGIIMRALAPFRVCRQCGYAEEGWGSGYWKLAPRKHEVPRLSRSTALKYTLRRLTQKQMDAIRYPKPKEGRVCA